MGFLLDEEGDEFGGGGSGGGHQSVYDDDTGSEDAVFDESDDNGEEVNDGLSGEEDEPQQQPQPQGFDYDKFARTLSQSLAPVIRGQNQPERKEMTDEEFRQATKYYAVQKERAAALFNPDTPIEEKMAALQEMLDGAATHAVSVSGLMLKRHGSEIDGRLAPLLNQSQTQVMDNFVKEVTKFSPSLKNMGSLVKVAMQQMAQSGYVSQGPKKDVEAVALAVKELAKQANPNFKLLRPVKKGGGRDGMPKQASSFNGAGGGHGVQRSNGKQNGFASIYGVKSR